MQTKRIQCPNCGVVLDVKNSKNEEMKQINCPSCATPLKVMFAPQQAPLLAKTFLATPKTPNADAGKTHLAGSNYGKTELAHPKAPVSKSAKLLCGGATYSLEEGQNIIGRQGATSRATVQIETDDRYMSRQHCSITIKTLPDGTKKAVLSNYQNKNLTSVDGQEIATNDEIRLTDGNRITMGHTTVTFKL